ncbi:metallophosphoesterase family protein [Kordia sp.]|uniref:metallophosphoesterase family protein n=1 Tax=Kordia sp. TaxID=1965332 RepID=UPI003B5BFD6C
MIRIAIFSDVHGKVLLPFKLVAEYQKQFDKKIDLIIQCGDLGAYPNLENLDKATIRHAKHDRDELGFHDDFTNSKHEISSFLQELDIQMLCVRGNHEDHDFLDDLEEKYAKDSAFPIDCYEYVWICKSGETQYFQKGEEKLSFVGLGRIGDRKGRQNKRFIQQYEYQKIKKLYKSKELFELFITHDSDTSGDVGYGSEEIREALDSIPFRYHFFGHTGKPYSRILDKNRITESIKVKELEFTTSGILPENCMMILEKENDSLKVHAVSTSFTNQFTKYDWKLK